MVGHKSNKSFCKKREKINRLHNGHKNWAKIKRAKKLAKKLTKKNIK